MGSCLDPRVIPRAEPEGFPEGSDDILLYAPDSCRDAVIFNHLCWPILSSDGASWSLLANIFQYWDLLTAGHPRAGRCWLVEVGIL